MSYMYISHWKKTVSQIHLFPPLSPYTPPPPPHPLHLAIPLYPTKLSLLETEPRNWHACGFLVCIQTSCKRESTHKHTQCMHDHMHTCRMCTSMHAYIHTNTCTYAHMGVCKHNSLLTRTRPFTVPRSSIMVTLTGLGKQQPTHRLVLSHLKTTHTTPLMSTEIPHIACSKFPPSIIKNKLGTHVSQTQMTSSQEQPILTWKQ